VTLLGRVVEVRRYPVKSMRGELLDAAEVDPRGLAGDRLWAVRDQDGKLGSGKSSRRFRLMEGLLELASSYDPDDLGVPVVRFPDGTVVRGDDDAVHDRLSETVGRRVELAREAAVVHFDAAPVHLCTTASLARLGALAAGSLVDPRRFRPNLVVDAPGASGFAEDAWVGARLRLGATLELAVSERTERCVMVGLAQQELPDDPRILGVVAEVNERCLGVYAEVTRPGRVRLGDEVRLA
jgi:uncharacterized protein YcbX